MSLVCYRCGAQLSKLTLPLSRRDECPACHVELHVCRMCVYYAAEVPKACMEDDALEVNEKTRANFCDWFKPKPDAFVPDEIEAERAARGELAALFGDAGSDEAAATADSAALEHAKALFDD